MPDAAPPNVPNPILNYRGKDPHAPLHHRVAIAAWMIMTLGLIIFVVGSVGVFTLFIDPIWRMPPGDVAGTLASISALLSTGMAVTASGHFLRRRRRWACIACIFLMGVIALFFVTVLIAIVVDLFQYPTYFSSPLEWFRFRIVPIVFALAFLSLTVVLLTSLIRFLRLRMV